MDVHQKRAIRGLLIGLLLFLAACSEEKKQTQVFPAEKPSCDFAKIKGHYLVEWENGKITKEPGHSREEFLESFVKPHLNKISYVEPDYLITLEQPAPQADVNALAKPSTQWGQVIMDVETAWKKSIYGEGVIVAVIDSGVDWQHPQLIHQLDINENEDPTNGIDDDGNGKIDDYYRWNFAQNQSEVVDEIGHGTHVSGVILAQHGAGPVKGLAPKAKLLPLDFMTKQGSYVTGSISDAIGAIDYAVERGAKVINASWGGEACSSILKNKIASLYEKNILFVTAAGNDGRNITDQPTFPASYNLSAMITVGALSAEGYQTYFSNWGELVHLVAPGHDIWSTIPQGSDEFNPSAREGWMSGTSMAAPFVTAQAALLWSYRPEATIDQVKAAILGSVVEGQFFVSTHGRAHIETAISNLEKSRP